MAAVAARCRLQPCLAVGIEVVAERPPLGDVCWFGVIAASCTLNCVRPPMARAVHAEAGQFRGMRGQFDLTSPSTSSNVRFSLTISTTCWIAGGGFGASRIIGNESVESEYLFPSAGDISGRSGMTNVVTEPRCNAGTSPSSMMTRRGFGPVPRPRAFATNTRSPEMATPRRHPAGGKVTDQLVLRGIDNPYRVDSGLRRPTAIS